jgi:hypothetical protein
MEEEEFCEQVIPKPSPSFITWTNFSRGSEKGATNNNETDYMVSIFEFFLHDPSSGSGTGSTQPREYN